MPRLVTAPRARALYRVAVAAAAISLAVGAWRVLVRHDRSPGLFWQLLFPLIVLRLALWLYRRSRAA